jgi:23S rRNA (pseudouridine1915-N3)-methyltransferase
MIFVIANYSYSLYLSFISLSFMKIQFWSVGKNHEPYIKAGVEEFTKRIAKYYPVEWSIIPLPKNSGMLSEADLKKKEGEMILTWLQKEDYLIALDERGKQMSSEGLADFMMKRSNESTRSLIFLIGGAYGIDEAVMKRANYTWSLSQLVFPHQLVRLMLAEQVYRACTINRNEKYHHS